MQNNHTYSDLHKNNIHIEMVGLNQNEYFIHLIYLNVTILYYHPYHFDSTSHNVQCTLYSVQWTLESPSRFVVRDARHMAL